MKDLPVDEFAAKVATKAPGLDRRNHDTSAQTKRKRGDTQTLGLRAFEKISAVEGIRLTGEMRRDLKGFDARHMDEGQRSRFIIGKYGRT